MRGIDPERWTATLCFPCERCGREVRRYWRGYPEVVWAVDDAVAGDDPDDAMRRRGCLEICWVCGNCKHKNIKPWREYPELLEYVTKRRTQ